MSNLLTFLSKDLRLVKLDLAKFTVVTTSKVANRNYEYFFNFNDHALSRYMCEFLAERGQNMPSGTLIGHCHAFSRLLEFLNDLGYETLNAESFSAFTEWLRRVDTRQTSVHFSESGRRGYGNFVLKFMEWLADSCVISVSDLFAARLRHQKAFQGSSARQLERMRLKAVSPEEYIRLIRAIRLEYEECKHLLERSRIEQDEYDITFPLLPFAMLLGMVLAVRSVEFNNLKVRDLRGDRLLLNPPNKKASEVWLPPSLMSSLALAQNWMSRYRTTPALDDPLLVCPLKEGPRANQLVPVDTILLSHSVKRFYRKYFDLAAPDGMPYLYSMAQEDESELLPYSLSFTNFRSAAITDVARYEPNPTIIMRFARHECFATTLKYYIRETHRQWVTNIATFLAPSAERVRICLDNKIAGSEEEEKARAAGAQVPGGHCEPALSGDHSCVRASDCRLCPFFRIHISKRELFVRDMEDALKEAQRLQSEQGLIRDAQNLREFAGLNQAIIDRIDEHLAGR
jgi:integrase